MKNHQARSGLCALTTAALLGASFALHAQGEPGYRFDFGPVAGPDHTVITGDDIFSIQAGWGIEPGAELEAVRLGDHAVSGDGLAGHGAFSFSVRVPEGNYRVRVHAASARETTLTIKAEARRLMAEQVPISPGEPTVVELVVNTRTPQFTQGEVRLNTREVGALNWDDKLSLEFLGDGAVITAIEIVPEADVPTVYLLGDSTVTDQPGEPYYGWGQMLPRFFDADIAVANHAESGRSVRSFLAEHRFDKVLDTLRAGDYVFIQFGHNDMKERGEGIGPYESFTDGLRRMVGEIEQRHATPVFVTPIHRRRFDPQGKVVDTLEQYPQAMRRLAEEDGIVLVDLNAMSARFYEAMGPRDSIAAFVHYPADTFPDQPKALRDDTHTNAYGAYVLARCMVQGVRAELPELAEHLTQDLPAFDPDHPPAPDAVVIPPSPPPMKNQTPEGK